MSHRCACRFEWTLEYSVCLKTWVLRKLPLTGRSYNSLITFSSLQRSVTICKRVYTERCWRCVANKVYGAMGEVYDLKVYRVTITFSQHIKAKPQQCAGRALATDWQRAAVIGVSFSGRLLMVGYLMRRAFRLQQFIFFRQRRETVDTKRLQSVGDEHRFRHRRRAHHRRVERRCHSHVVMQQRALPGMLSV